MHPELFERYLQERCTPEEEQQLLELLENDESAQQEFVRISEEFALFASIGQKLSQSEPVQTKRVIAPLILAIAAALILSLTILLTQDASQPFEAALSDAIHVSAVDIESSGNNIVVLSVQQHRNPEGTSLALSQLNLDGTANWHRELNTPGRDQATAISVTQDGGVLVAGTFRTDQQRTSGDFLLIRTNVDGTTRWVRTWQGAGRERFEDAAELTDGTIVATGFALPNILNLTEDRKLEVSGAPFDLHGYCACVLYGLTPDGEPRWSYGFDPSTPRPSQLINYILPKIVSHPDGGFFLIGSTDGFGPGGSDVFAMRFNSSGEPQWQRVFGSTLGELAMAATRTDDGILWITGRHSVPGDLTVAESPFVIRINEQGEMLESFLLESDGPFAPTSIITHDDSVFLSGRRHAPSPFDADGVIVRMSVRGDLEWSHRYHHSPHDTIYNLTHGTNRLIAAGETEFNAIPGKISGWVFTVELDGSTQVNRRPGNISKKPLDFSIAEVEFPQIDPELALGKVSVSNSPINPTYKISEKQRK